MNLLAMICCLGQSAVRRLTNPFAVTPVSSDLSRSFLGASLSSVICLAKFWCSGPWSFLRGRFSSLVCLEKLWCLGTLLFPPACGRANKETFTVSLTRMMDHLCPIILSVRSLVSLVSCQNTPTKLPEQQTHQICRILIIFILSSNI